MRAKFTAFAAFLLIAPAVLRSQDATVDKPSHRLYVTQIAAAEALLQLNKISEARAYLDACDEQLRGIEWHFLKAALDRSAATVLAPDGAAFTTSRLSPDGRLLAAAGSNKIISLYSYPGLQHIRELKGHAGSVSTIAFNSTGTRLVSGGRDHAVIVWDVATGAQVAGNAAAFSQGIYQVRYSGNDSLIGVVSWQLDRTRTPSVIGFVKVLDARDASEQSKIETDNHPAAGIVFLPDYRTMVVSTWGEVAYSYDVHTRALKWKYDLADPAEYNAFHSIDLSSDGATVALGSTDHRIHLLNSADGRVLRRIEPWEGHTKIIKALAYSRDGRWLASAGEDQTVFIWNTADHSKHASLIGHVGTVNGLSWSGDSKALLSTSQDGTLKEWNLERPFERTYEICDFGPWQTPLTSDGRYFAAPSSDKKLVIYEAATGTSFADLGAQSGLAADLSRDAQSLVTASFDGIVRLWDIPGRRELRQFRGHTARVDGVGYLNASKQLVSVGDSTLRAWSRVSGENVKTVHVAGSPFRIVLHPDETRAYVSCGNGMLRAFDTRSWAEVGSLQCASSAQEMAISRDGKSLAVYAGRNIEVWDTQTNQRRHLLAGHEGAGYGVGFSPDGRYLISGSNDQTFKLWDLDRGVCTFTYHGYQDTPYNTKFLSERSLLIMSSQGKVRVYRF